MREILFRGKSADNGEWVEGFYFCMTHPDNRHTHHFIIPLNVDISKGTQIDKIQIEVIPETVGQYTGLTDKNGKKIFEGDILRKAYYPEKDTVVEYFDGSYRFKYIRTFGRSIKGEYSYLCFIQSAVLELKVIGNIFDNPELLEVQQ